MEILGTGWVSRIFDGLASLVSLSHLHRNTAAMILLVGVTKAAEKLSDIIHTFRQKHERFDKIAFALAGILKMA